jgi:REP element-mobilizing transposase RayT
MSVREKHDDNDQIYFCTVTCYSWINLIQITNLFDNIYSWFDILTQKGCKILGYVLMPNHFHNLIYIPEDTNNLNSLFSNGKRFMSYEIIKRLTEQENWDLLNILEKGVSEKEKAKGQNHVVFRPSFDARPCDNESLIIQKLDYMHANPVSGKWNLVDVFTDYIHSSAKFYELNEQGIYPVTHYKEIIG